MPGQTKPEPFHPEDANKSSTLSAVLVVLWCFCASFYVEYCDCGLYNTYHASAKRHRKVSKEDSRTCLKLISRQKYSNIGNVIVLFV